MTKVLKGIGNMICKFREKKRKEKRTTNININIKRKKRKRKHNKLIWPDLIGRARPGGFEIA